MRDFTEQQNTIRQFLLGQLTAPKSEELEDLIFAEPDFAEEVQIVEDELITEYRAGGMRTEDRVLFEARYSRNSANQAALEYEKVFGEFILSKSKGNPLPTGLKPSELLLSTTQTSAPSESLKITRESRGPWLFFVFKTHRALAYSVLLACLLSSIVVVWLLSGHYRFQSGNNPIQVQRQAIEVELARLNATGRALPEKVVSTADLQPSERYQGAMARIEARKTPDALIEFRLNLMQASTQKYRAVFLDDRQNELFAISNLTAQNTPSGPTIRLFVPTRYLNPGDYQVNLSVSNKSGGNDEINGYSFRVVESRATISGTRYSSL
jgi:hypothetical protein